MSNRFDKGSVSAYTPQSFQELSFTPMMKRAQHDEMSKNLAELDAIATDPLNEHRDEALRLKQEFEGKLGNMSGELASKGIDNIGKENFYRLKKEHDDLIAPTGKIGQINFAKKDYNSQKEAYLTNAEKQNIGRDQALVRWGQKTGDYTGYDKDKNITNVTPQGVAAYQDYEKYKQNVHALLGKVESETKDGNYQLRDSRLGNGTKVMVNSKGFKKESTNLDALNNAILAGNEMWLKPTGEGYKYNVDAGVDQNNFRNRFVGDFGSMLETSKGRGYEENGQFINDASGPKVDETNENNPFEGLNIGTNVIEDTSANKALDNITRSFGNKLIDFYKISNTENNTRLTSYKNNLRKQGFTETEVQKKAKDYNKPFMREILKKTADKYVNTTEYKYLLKTFKDNGLVNTNADIYDPQAYEKIANYLNENKTFRRENQIITTDKLKNNELFETQVEGKDANKRDENFKRRIAMGNARLLNAETGDEIDPADVEESTYLGVYSAKSIPKFVKEKFQNENQQIMPHYGEIKIDGKKIKVIASRDESDFQTPEFQGGKFVHNLTNIIDQRPGLYQKYNLPEFRNHGLTNVEIRFNKNNQTYDVRYTKNGKVRNDPPKSNTEFQKTLFELKTN